MLYFPLEKYTILFTPGEANADNSELEVSDTEVFVGDPIKAFITPRDKYNNLIDANRYKDESPFQVKYTDGDETKVITKKHEIEERDDHTVLSYEVIFTIKGTSYVSGYLDTLPIKCVSCVVNVKAKDLDFLNYKALRYESQRNTFDH